MSTTPAKSRSANIPGPGRSHIPTPGRIRSTSSASNQHVSLPADSVAIERAFADAILANDPTRHSSSRVSSPRRTDTGRPPSVAPSVRPKTPSVSLNKSAYRRPESRQSDVFSRTQRSFEVGDNVRIESLGCEGILAYLGEIDGKQGMWAGVELSGGFAGKGKNDGSVDGKRYFQCSPKCGVFVATNKLSPPTVGLGANSRPSSVASSRASMSGRITPSFVGQSSHNTRANPISDGRVTPSLPNGRRTPSSSFGFSTPARARAASKSSSHPVPLPAINTPSASAMSRITAGSRASKYIGMTAKQLSARNGKPSASPTRDSIGSSSPGRSTGIGSPTSSFGSGSPTTVSANASTATPKPVSRLYGIGTPKGFGSGRPSLPTPRARIPSAIAMPPPPSPSSGNTSRSVSLNDKPITPTFSSASNDTAVDDEGPQSLTSIQLNSRALQDKILQLSSGKMTPSSRRSSPTNVPLKENGDTTINSQRLSTEGFQSILDRLERENLALRLEIDQKREVSEDTVHVDDIQRERDQTLSRISELELQAKAADRSLKERESKIESLERSAQVSSDTLERLRSESEARMKDFRAKLRDADNLISSLKEAVDVKANEAGQNEGLIQVKNTEISQLEERVKKTTMDLEETRRELGGQVDELRHAGQETIALYEERLSAAETKRYELEDLIGSLEEQVKMNARPPSPATITRHASEAAQIDNETLREQASYLQKRIAILEDMLEDSRAMYEREEAAMRQRVTKYKDNEGLMKKEVTDARKEVERLEKLELSARGRTEEIEEALRENTLALENARAEIEGLRAELADLEGLQTGHTANDSVKTKEAHSAATERTRYTDEITQLNDLLEITRNAKREAVQQLEITKSEALEAVRSLSGLRETIGTLDSEKAELEHVLQDHQAKLENERALVIELRRVLDQKTAEFESARKSFNRDRPLHNDLSSSSSSPSKQDTQSARDEIKGLKHIVQSLQKENATAANQNKLLESENKMLLSETEQLREELKALEENIEQSLLREEKTLDSSSEDAVALYDDTPASQKVIRELKIKHDMDMDHLRKKLADLEMKSARTIHDLNKEVGELESLIEAKIYHEDDLAREIEHLKGKLSRNKKSSKSSIEAPVAEQRLRLSPSNGAQASLAPPVHEVCEICEQPGHDIFSCPVLKDDSSTTGLLPKMASKPVNTLDLFCEDCESHGHIAADCPHSLDVF